MMNSGFSSYLGDPAAQRNLEIKTDGESFHSSQCDTLSVFFCTWKTSISGKSGWSSDTRRSCGTGLTCHREIFTRSYSVFVMIYFSILSLTVLTCSSSRALYSSRSLGSRLSWFTFNGSKQACYTFVFSRMFLWLVFLYFSQHLIG